MSDYKKKKNILDSIIKVVGGEHSGIIPTIITNGQPINDDDFIEEIPSQVPILPLRGNVFFPSILMPVTAGRSRSIALIKDAYHDKKIIGIVSQSNDADEPTEEDLFKVGTFARVMETITMPDDSVMVILQGLDRFKFNGFTTQEPYWMGTYEHYADTCKKLPKDADILASMLKDMYMKLLKMTPNVPPNLVLAPKNIKSPYYLLNYVSSQLNISLEDKQKLLEMNDFSKRMKKVLSYLDKEIHEEEVKMQIQQKVSSDIDKQQREYFLHQQLKTIQEELGNNPTDQTIKELEERAKKKEGWTQEAKQTFEKEMKKLSTMHYSSPEYSIQLSYLSFILDLPWNKLSDNKFSIEEARKVLDEDHYGLEKVKERIIEHLSVLKISAKQPSAPILCLVGPPGVGKTSLGKSIARAINREYVRVALGGVNDESEIRGHRRTYIGAMPGRILKSLSKMKSADCVFVLDEIDKIGTMSAHGDPSSAMLEVLDPEQNTAFHDNYLDIDYDLSKIMFIATANSLSNVHPALIDRMEVINIAGYIEEEKLEIAKRHLIARSIKANGLKKSQLTMSDDIIQNLIQNYTRESGVRRLDKMISKIVRHRAVEVAEGKKFKRAIKQEDLQPILGLPTAYHDLILEEDTVGVVTGLAWTEVGGEILFVEASTCKGKGEIHLTGNLGNVMKESATLAFEYLKSNSKILGVRDNDLETKDLNIHCPEGATPKDGPSAGITMFTAMLSVFTNRAVKHNFAMTGEITLRGKVLPVGGIKEKILAAKRAKITDIVLSKKNKKDIEDINQIYLSGLTFHYVDLVAEIPDIVLVKKKKQ
ncbi:MAG: endopeptidase La [Bacteroidales bacterium]|nr:endopeptidase La [Bacteroidales bacterium]